MPDPKRLNEMLKLVRQKIRKNPKVLARFDKDGNGVIDGDEWEEVRQLAIRRLERLEAEEQAAQAAKAELTVEKAKIAALQTGAASAFAMTTEVLTSQLVDQDLTTAISPGEGDHAGIADARELVLEEKGSLGKVIASRMTKRQYEIKDQLGRVLAQIEQVESEFMQDMKYRSFFELPEWNFRLRSIDPPLNLTLRRSQAIAKDRMDVIGENGAVIAHVLWKFSIIARVYELYSVDSAQKTILKQPILKPFTMLLLDENENEIGQVEKGWSGLGAFLTGGNRMRISLSKPAAISTNLRFAMLAGCLLEDVKSEQQRKK